MASGNPEPEAVAVLQQLVGQKMERARLGISPTLVLELGALMRDPTGDERFEWYLWIKHCSWRVEADGIIVLGSNDDREEAGDVGAKADAAVLDRLASLTVESVFLAEPMGDLVIAFSENVVVRTFADQRSVDTYACWQLFTPTDQIVEKLTDGRLLIAE